MYIELGIEEEFWMHFGAIDCEFCWEEWNRGDSVVVD